MGEDQCDFANQPVSTHEPNPNGAATNPTLASPPTIVRKTRQPGPLHIVLIGMVFSLRTVTNYRGRVIFFKAVNFQLKRTGTVNRE